MVQNWSLTGPNWSLPPRAHPRRQQKFPVRGQTNYKKHIFDDFYDFYEKGQKQVPLIGIV